jgi:hypothetical protein
LGSKKKNVFDDATKDLDIMPSFSIKGQGRVASENLKMFKSKNSVHQTGVDAGI